MTVTNENSTSLNKFISESGFCSRREADVIIKAGRVTINGIVASTGNRVADGDEVPCGALYAGGRIGQVGELSSRAHYARGEAADSSVFSLLAGLALRLPRQA